MRVKCVKGYSGLLTVGKIYDVISISKSGDQRVKCDNGTIDGFLPAGGYLIPVDETKEKNVKIKAKEDCHFGAYKVGDVFEAHETPVSYLFKDNDGDERLRHKSEFDVVPDEPAIEVGSVWVNAHGHELTVNYASKEIAICTWKHNGKEFASPLKNHLKFYKPKPKTVTMYFYERRGGGYDAFDFELGASYNGLAFTREIELP